MVDFINGIGRLIGRIAEFVGLLATGITAQLLVCMLFVACLVPFFWAYQESGKRRQRRRTLAWYREQGLPVEEALQTFKQHDESDRRMRKAMRHVRYPWLFGPLPPRPPIKVPRHLTRDEQIAWAQANFSASVERWNETHPNDQI